VRTWTQLDQVIATVQTLPQHHQPLGGKTEPSLMVVVLSVSKFRSHSSSNL